MLVSPEVKQKLSEISLHTKRVGENSERGGRPEFTTTTAVGTVRAYETHTDRTIIAIYDAKKKQGVWAEETSNGVHVIGIKRKKFLKLPIERARTTAKKLVFAAAEELAARQ